MHVCTFKTERFVGELAFSQQDFVVVPDIGYDYNYEIIYSNESPLEEVVQHYITCYFPFKVIVTTEAGGANIHMDGEVQVYESWEEN